MFLVLLLGLAHSQGCVHALFASTDIDVVLIVCEVSSGVGILCLLAHARGGKVGGGGCDVWVYMCRHHKRMQVLPPYVQLPQVLLCVHWVLYRVACVISLGAPYMLIGTGKDTDGVTVVCLSLSGVAVNIFLS
jgi:hypothetical protein